MFSNSDEGNKNNNLPKYKDNNNPKYIIKSFMQQTRQTLGHQDLRVLDFCQRCSHAAVRRDERPRTCVTCNLYFSTCSEEFYTKSQEKAILQSLLTLQVGQRRFCHEVQLLDRSKVIAFFGLPWNLMHLTEGRRLKLWTEGSRMHQFAEMVLPIPGALLAMCACMNQHRCVWRLGEVDHGFWTSSVSQYILCCVLTPVHLWWHNIGSKPQEASVCLSR